MENTSHVLVVGEGAERLANKLGVEEVDEEWLITDYARCLVVFTSQIANLETQDTRHLAQKQI